MKRSRDLLQRTFSFSDAHAVANGISSLLTVRSCWLRATGHYCLLMLCSFMLALFDLLFD